MKIEIRIQEPSRFLRKRERLIFAAAVLFATLHIVPQEAHAQGDTRSGKDVVEKVCIACHGTGANGAPKIGDAKAWKARASKGLTGLTKNALQGIRKMPAHGGQPGLSDLDIARAITYMVNHSGGHWVEPASAEELTKERSGEEVVKAQCVKCHGTGVGGAPKIGDQNAWIPRVKNGIDYLVHSAIRGHGGMPARGGLASLTDNEIRSAIIYMFNPAAAHAAESRKVNEAVQVGPDHMIAGAMDIYFGVVSAEAILSYPKESAERSMHGGVPRGADNYHVNVTLWDHVTNAPINSAQVSVQIQGIGGAIESKTLEPMVLGTGSYGSYVKMQKNRSYMIIVQVRTAESPTVTNARFEYRIE
ncbi:MAG TPA: c-type cytochrome [Candidatus Methylomirabilis sp.]|nr:c-type cytochrome [Candidatus Methylomirabilis sp.]